jgi:hypothetical protein
MVEEHTHRHAVLLHNASVHHKFLPVKPAKTLTMADINKMFSSTMKVPEVTVDVRGLLRGAEAQFPVQGLDRGERAEDFFRTKSPP